MPRSRPALPADVHALARAMPHVTEAGSSGHEVYQVGGTSFVLFRTPRPDAVDPDTGERYTDLILFWVADESEKQSRVQDVSSPFFTTDHFTGHLSVLVRASRLAEISYDELAELVEEAWLARASKTRQKAWLAEHPDRS